MNENTASKVLKQVQATKLLVLEDLCKIYTYCQSRYVCLTYKCTTVLMNMQIQGIYISPTLDDILGSYRTVT